MTEGRVDGDRVEVRAGPAGADRLLISGGHVLDPANGIDGTATISIAGGAITSVTSGAPEGAGTDRGETVDAAGLYVMPGLVDLHTHLYEGVSHYGIDPDTYCLGRGVTTAVDAGSAGAQTFPGFRRYVIERSDTRVLAFLHIAVQGMITNLLGELEDLRWASVSQAVARAREHPDLIVGIKVRLGYQMVGSDPAPALRLARRAADELGLPLMVHVIDMQSPIAWLLGHLGRGDVVTHSFHGNEGGILDETGRLHPAVWRARETGVLFDIGHGVGSFAYGVARAAVDQGFPPDTISSDIHRHNIGGPCFDQATTLSKLLHVGMELPDIARASTSAPARAVHRHESLGSLTPGREADITAFELRSGSWLLPDASGASEVVERLLVPRFVVRRGVLRDIDWPVEGLLARWHGGESVPSVA